MTIALSLTIRPQFAVEYLRHSNQQRVRHFRAKCGDEGVHRREPNLMRSGRDERLSYAKQIESISSAVGAQCTNVTDRQTNRQADLRFCNLAKHLCLHWQITDTRGVPQFA